MKKQLLSMAVAAVAVVAITPDAQAQNTSALSLIGGARFGVTAPASLAGSPVATFGSTESGWGISFANPVINVPVVRALGINYNNTDSLLCSPAANGTNGIPPLTGKVAILYRGSCNFVDKALEAQNAGAVGVIVVNNAPGAPISMGSGTTGTQVTIPVFMVTDVDGGALWRAVAAGTNVTVTMSEWSLGYANDVAIVAASSASAHGGALPLNQLGTNNGNPAAYRMFNGSVAANFGTSVQTNLKTATTVNWIPAGGTATQVWTDTGSLASLTPADSIDIVSSTNYFNPHAATKGRFVMNSQLVSTVGDISNLDNGEERSVYITDSIYCKGTWDAAANHPKYQVAYGYKNQSLPLTWGPLFYTAIGGQFPEKLQFSLSKKGVATLNGISATTCAFKWVDGAAGNPVDGVFQEGELTLIGTGYKTFSTADSNFRDIMIPFDANSSPGGAIPALSDSSWYYYTVTPTDPATYFVGDDNDIARITIANQVDPNHREYPTPQYTGDIDAIILGGTGGGTFRMVTGYNDPNYPVDSLYLTVPIRSFNVALHVMNGNPTKVDALSPAINTFSIFPNPAKNVLTVEYAFNKNVGTSTITIFDGMGRAVKVQQLHDQAGKATFSVSEFASGNYWMVLGNSLGSKAYQFQVAK